MSGTKLTDKTALTEQLASIDLLMVVDKSDGTGSADGTSKAVQNKYIIQTDIISLNSAQCNALNTSPQTLVSSPGADYIIQPLRFTLIATYISAENTNNFNLYIGYNTTPSTTNFIYTQRGFYRNEGTEDRTYIVGAVAPSDGTFNGSIVDKPIGIWSAGNYNGNWGMKVLVTYQIVKL